MFQIIVSCPNETYILCYVTIFGMMKLFEKLNEVKF